MIWQLPPVSVDVTLKANNQARQSQFEGWH